MKDRAMQTLHKMALEPVTETLADGTSYGFRPNRCVQDAIEQCFVDLARKTAPEWVLEGDIKGCFDNINHEWMQKNIPMDKEILHKFLKAGFVEKPAAWIRDKYFHRIGNRSWTFSEKLTEDNYLALVYATDTNITRFTRIKAEANPYDEIWMEYFAERKNKSYSNFKFVYE